MKEFKNVHNKCYNTKDGIVWNSRSVAVVGVIIAKYKDEYYALISKRGQGAADNKGLFNNVCGYLDKNETTFDAILREIWEEVGIDMDGLISTKEVYYSTQPFITLSEPVENRQNVSLLYGFTLVVDELPETSTKNSEKNEVEEIKWVKIDDIDLYQYAYNHNNVIKFYFKHFLYNHPKELVIPHD